MQFHGGLFRSRDFVNNATELVVIVTPYMVNPVARQELARPLAPDIILGNWRGRKIGPAQIAQRPGWNTIPAVRENRMIEIKTTDFHVPGPGVITRGLKRISGVIGEWV